MRTRRTCVLTVALAAASIVTAAPAFAAGKTVPGEKWQQNITMQMQGLTMPMGNHEICAPVGKAGAELSKPEKNCAISNARQVGNKFSADVKCGGKDAMEGSIEQTVNGDQISGRMKVKSAEGEMTMVMESKKLGACQAVDTEELVATVKAQAAAAAATAPKVDVCGSAAANMKKSPQQVGAAAAMFVQEGGPCVTRPANAEFCAAIQTRGGFASLAGVESSMRDITAKSLSACNLGQGKAGVDALRAKLAKSAETDGDTDFLEANAPARARELARTQCVLKGEMWAGKTSKLDAFCDSNFAEDARRGK